jgi:hypothetical protein
MDNEKVTLTTEQVTFIRTLDAEIARAQAHAESMSAAKQLYVGQILKAVGITDGQFKIDLETGMITPKGA